MLSNQDHTADKMREVYPYKVDLTNCDVEPLRHIQVIQSHTCLVAAGKEDLVVRFVSDNAEERIGIPWQDMMDRPLSQVLSRDVFVQISMGLDRPDNFQTINPVQGSFLVGGERLFKNIIAHIAGEYLVLEVEPVVDAFHTSSYQQELGRSVQLIQSFTEMDGLFRETANIIRKLTGYDRVMVYRFDEEYNGEVIAESLVPELDPFLGLRYPHTDIPAQARELYLRNRIRIIGSTQDIPARLHGSSEAGTEYLDLSLAHGRGVSPVHLEYLGYMGVHSSMSIAIVVEGKLWGLFALHHYRPIFLDYQLRSFLLFLGQVFSGHLAIHAASRYREETLSRNMMRSVLGEQISTNNDVLGGLTSGKFNLLGVLPGVTGSAARFEEAFTSIGDTPTEEEVMEIVDWVRGQPETELFYQTNALSEKYPSAKRLRDVASGILVIFLSPERTDWIVWFRPEVSQTISWGGKPVKQILKTPDGSHRLSPRKSFEKYVERVECCAEKWTQVEIDTALALRVHVKDSALQRYAEVRRMHSELRGAYEELESFSYTVSHDLRAPLRAIEGFAQILSEDFAEGLGEEGSEMLGLIQANVSRMNDFIGDILEMSRVGRAHIIANPLHVPGMLQQILLEQGVHHRRDKQVVVRIDEDFPVIYGDERLIRQVYSNLIGNALKYGTANEEGEMLLHIGHESDPATGRLHLFVANSGSSVPAGFEDSIFDIFSRATVDEGREGTGIGLAIVKRIVNRHGGDVWVAPNTPGAKFVFYLNASK